MAGIGAVLLLLALGLCIFAVNGIGADQLEIKTVDPKTAVDVSQSSNNSSVEKTGKLSSDSVLVDKVVKGKDQGIGIQGEVKVDPGKNNVSKELSLEKDPEVGAAVHNLSKEVGVKKGRKENKGTREGSESNNNVRKEDKLDGNLIPLKKPSRKEITRGEDCDSSNKCVDDVNKVIACLRVPGNDSPDYSLLIQNKGTSPLSINISAPQFVQLEKSIVQILPKEDKKVKFSIGDGDNNTLILLSAGSGHCNLDFHDLVLHNSGKKASNYVNSAYTAFLSRPPSILYIFSGAVFLIVSVCICIKLRKRNISPDDTKYQKLETELPVSVVGVVVADDKVSDIGDGWDNSWGDSWDDEEAPKTPSMPVTPSLSSKGLASRRINKEAWKD